MNEGGCVITENKEVLKDECVIITVNSLNIKEHLQHPDPKPFKCFFLNVELTSGLELRVFIFHTHLAHEPYAVHKGIDSLSRPFSFERRESARVSKISTDE